MTQKVWKIRWENREVNGMKKRLDVLIFEKGFAQSREKARALIMEGGVYVDNQKADKPGMIYQSTLNIEVRKNKLQYVSRGGLKLHKALKVFNIELCGCIAMDVGASTGGFTDCMLQNGCKKVYAIDVGYGQLAWSLRNDPRVINIERTNIRYIDRELIDENINFFSVDVSFISLLKVLPVIGEIIEDGTRGICLIKPQFEAGRDKVGKKGVVRDKGVRKEVIDKIIEFCISNRYSVLGLDYSPIKGPEGNIEYLLHILKSENPVIYEGVDSEQAVEESMINLNGGIA